MSKRPVSLHLFDIKFNKLGQLVNEIGGMSLVTRLIFPQFYFPFISNVVIEINEYTNKTLFIFDNKMRVLCLSITSIISLVLWGNQQLKFEQFGKYNPGLFRNFLLISNIYIIIHE